ncbi:hypothetical protein LguiA_001726 [Lonicera macranthoides]
MPDLAPDVNLSNPAVIEINSDSNKVVGYVNSKSPPLANAGAKERSIQPRKLANRKFHSYYKNTESKSLNHRCSPKHRTEWDERIYRLVSLQMEKRIREEGGERIREEGVLLRSGNSGNSSYNVSQFTDRAELMDTSSSQNVFKFGLCLTHEFRTNFYSDDHDSSLEQFDVYDCLTCPIRPEIASTIL